jgi:hypothetical protein
VSDTVQVELKVNECKPLKRGAWGHTSDTTPRRRPRHGQGLTLVHSSAHRKRFLWDRGSG